MSFGIRIEVLAIGEGFGIDVGDAADACVGGDDSAGGKIDVLEGGVNVERCSCGVLLVERACVTVDGERAAAGNLGTEFNWATP